MIVRSWTGRATERGTQAYLAHFQRTVRPQLQHIDGFRGALVLSRAVGEEVEVVVLTFWESRAATQRFAGEDPSVAVVAPEARAALKEFDSHVKHFEVLLDARGHGREDRLAPP